MTILNDPLLMIGVQSQKLFVIARTVLEVHGEKSWIPIPGTRQELPGVVGWGRRAVALLDLARVFPGLRALATGERRQRTLLLQVGESNLAVPADSVSSVLDIDTSAVRRRALTEFPLCRNEVHLEGAVLPLLDPTMLFALAGAE